MTICRCWSLFLSYHATFPSPIDTRSTIEHLRRNEEALVTFSARILHSNEQAMSQQSDQVTRAQVPMTLPWNCGNSGALLSDGMVKIWQHITTMPDIGKKLGDFLNGLPGSATVIVAGHSLGAASASMIALWVQQTWQAGRHCLKRKRAQK